KCAVCVWVFAVRQFARPWASKLLVVPVGFSGGVSRTLVLERPFFVSRFLNAAARFCCGRLGLVGVWKWLGVYGYRAVQDTGLPMSLDLATLRPAFYVTTWG